MNKVSPEKLLNESSVGWPRAKMRDEFRKFLKLLAAREECSHESAVCMVADRCNKSPATIYSWLSDCDRHYPCPWSVFDMLRYEFVMQQEFQNNKAVNQMLSAYDKDWQSQNTPRLMGKAKVLRRPAK